MNKDHQHILLKAAKTAVDAAVHGRRSVGGDCTVPELNVREGCFVTIKNNERLRGCIGQFTSDKALVGLVREMAVAAAVRDPRFRRDPITPCELEQLDIEISVLSAMERTDDPLSLELGKHGIYIVRGVQSGCFLPQVATETGWSKEEFLDYCCAHKAGLPPDAWKHPDTEVYLFTADAFHAAYSDI